MFKQKQKDKTKNSNKKLYLRVLFILLKQKKAPKMPRGFLKGNDAWRLKNKKKKRCNHFEENNKFGNVKKERDIAPPLPKRLPSKRIKEKEISKTFDEESQYLLGKKSNLETLFNDSFKSHVKFNSKCKGNLRLKLINQILISSTWALSCDRCKFVGKPYKLYQEYCREGRQKQGKQNSTLNDSLGFALLSLPIGAHNFYELFIKLGLDPGSMNGLNRLLRRVGDQMVDLGNLVLKETVEEVKMYTTRWIVTTDTRYNNPLFSPTTPYQYGNQAVTTAAEGVTGENKIVHVGTFSKLCTTGQRLRSLGYDIRCPDHSYCTANLKQHDSIGDEGKYVEVMANDLKNEGAELATVCADGDTKIRKGVKRVFSECEFQNDSRHFIESHRKKCKSSTFSNEMFPLKKKNDIDYRKQFETDFVKRCTAEFNQAHNKARKFQNEPQKMKNEMNKLLRNVPKTIVHCYAGDHSTCKQNSFVCKPPEHKWPKYYLHESQKYGLNMTESDRNLVEELAGYRLGEKAVENTYLNLNTQQVEAMNKKYNKSNPKGVTCVRTFKPRILSMVVDKNLGFSEATYRMHTVANHSICGKIRVKILKHEQQVNLIKRKKKEPKYKVKRRLKWTHLVDLHNKRGFIDNETEKYEKGCGILDSEN